MIDVRLFADLPEHSRSRRRRLEIVARDGLTVREVLVDEGIDPDLVKIVMVNGMHAGLDQEVRDGDRVALFPPVGGG